jgi:hypothetical protein
MATTYDKIGTTTLTSPAAEIDFTSFSGYTDLVLIVNASMTVTGGSTYVRFNNDSSSNNRIVFIVNNFGTKINTTTNGVGLGTFNGNSAQPWVSEMHIFNYANTTQNKSVMCRSGSPEAGGTSSTEVICSSWENTAAITSIKVRYNQAGNFATGSTFTLYGILRA